MLALTLRTLPCSQAVAERRRLEPDGFILGGLVEELVSSALGRPATLALHDVGEPASDELLGSVRAELLALLGEDKASSQRERQEAREALSLLDKHIPVGPVTHAADEAVLRAILRRNLKGHLAAPDALALVLGAIGLPTTPDRARRLLTEAIARLDAGGPIQVARDVPVWLLSARALAAYDDVRRILGREPVVDPSQGEALVVGSLHGLFTGVQAPDRRAREAGMKKPRVHFSRTGRSRRRLRSPSARCFFVWTGRTSWRTIYADEPEEAACRAVEEVEAERCHFAVGSGRGSWTVRVKVDGELRSYVVTGQLMPSYTVEAIA